MVKFSSIKIQFADEKLGFDCLDLFNEFRHTAWALSSIQERNKWISIFNAHVNLEQIAEQKFNLPAGTLKGLCLAYGTSRIAFKQLRKPELVSFLAHWNTTVKINIRVPENRMTISIIGSKYKTRIIAPIKHSLLPSQEIIHRAYNQVAVRKQLGLPPQKWKLKLNRYQ